MNKISVIIPVYNSEKYLCACLDSVLEQTYQNLEIILVDDGSKDSSGEICDQYALKYDKITVIHKANEGVSAARNDGLAVATGDWISFIDSDDTMESDMYELLLNVARKHNAEIAHCGYKRLNESGELINNVSGTHLILVQSPLEAVDCMLAGRYFVGGLWNKLFSHNCIQGVTFCTELKNNEDILFNALAFQNAERIVFVDETKYCYYEHSSSACNQVEQEKQIRDSVQASQRLLLGCRTNAMREVAKRWCFRTKSNLYRLLLFQKKADGREIKDIRMWLKDSYSKLNGLDRRTKVNYLLMVYSSGIYRWVYRIYNRIRKPNWDVQ